MPQDNTQPVVPVDPNVTVTTPPVVTDTQTVTPAPVATESTVVDATNVVPGPEAVKVELPKVEESVITPVVTVPPTV